MWLLSSSRVKTVCSSAADFILFSWTIFNIVISYQPSQALGSGGLSEVFFLASTEIQWNTGPSQCTYHIHAATWYQQTSNMAIHRDSWTHTWISIWIYDIWVYVYIYIFVFMYTYHIYIHRHVHSQAHTCTNNLRLWVGCRSHGKAWAINTLWTHLESLLVSPVASVTNMHKQATRLDISLKAHALMRMNSCAWALPIAPSIQSMNPCRIHGNENEQTTLEEAWKQIRAHTHTNADALNASHRHKHRAAQVETYTDRKGNSQVCMTLLHHRTPLHFTSPHNQRWSACFFHWFTVIHCSHEVKPWMFSVMNWRPKAPWIFQWVEPEKSERTTGSRLWVGDYWLIGVLGLRFSADAGCVFQSCPVLACESCRSFWWISPIGWSASQFLGRDMGCEPGIVSSQDSGWSEMISCFFRGHFLIIS